MLNAQPQLMLIWLEADIYPNAMLNEEVELLAIRDQFRASSQKEQQHGNADKQALFIKLHAMPLVERDDLPLCCTIWLATRLARGRSPEYCKENYIDCCD